MMSRSAWWLILTLAMTLALSGPIQSGEAARDIVLKVVMVEDEDEDPAAAGKAAAEKLQATMGDVPLQAVIVSECFEDRENKEKLLKGICSVLPAKVVFGGATYGSFTQQGCTDFDAVCLLGLGGERLTVSTALVTNMGAAKLAFDQQQALIVKQLRAAGKDLANSLHRCQCDGLCILIADAHSPKNQSLVEGVQSVLGKDFPITGGCCNKNAGQTFIYYKGKLYEDSALALMLGGNFKVSLSGRQANVNDKVISTAKDGAAEAMTFARGTPLAVLAFNCAGRRSKLKRYEDELNAMREAIGTTLPIFGCYCAGEIGPLDEPGKPTDARCGGSGWHVMFTVISQPAPASK